MSKIKLNKNKIYSAREALQFFKNIRSEPAFRKFIENDISGENLLNAKILLRGKQRRFFIKGESILKIIEAQKIK